MESSPLAVDDGLIRQPILWLVCGLVRLLVGLLVVRMVQHLLIGSLGTCLHCRLKEWLTGLLCSIRTARVVTLVLSSGHCLLRCNSLYFLPLLSEAGLQLLHFICQGVRDCHSGAPIINS